MAIALALVSAVLYGISDFFAARSSRRSPAIAVALYSELTMFAACVVAIPLIEDDGPTPAAVWWGLLSGAAGSIAVFGLYVALSRGNITVVAPITGVLAAVVPVLTGIAIGERPGVVALCGIVLAIVAVALISGAADMFGRGSGLTTIGGGMLILAIAVGCGFGIMFIALARTGESGWWPLLFARFSSTPLLALVYLRLCRERHVAIARGVLLPAVVVGVLVMGSNAAYLVSTREELLSKVAVIVSMYPAGTVLLATVYDGERATLPQLAGMLLAAGSVVMVTVG